MKAILHIGLEKTGTTSVQQLLKANREALLKQGTLVPVSLHPGNNFFLAMASFSSFRSDGLLRQQGIKDQAGLDAFRSRTIAKFRGELNSVKAAKQVLISSEHLQSRLVSLEDIQLLKSNLESVGLNDFEVLVYLREPIRIALSHHSMAIKKGVYVQDTFFEPNHPRVSQILSFQKSIELWRKVFGPENINVRLYPEGQRPSVLIDDFFEATGLDQSGLKFEANEKRNANLSAGALNILNALNSANKLIAHQDASKTFFDRLEKHTPGRGLSASEETISKFNTHYAASNEWVRASFFAHQVELFERPLAAGPDAELELKDVLGVLSAALEVIELRDKELARLKSRFALLPAGIKRLLKRLVSR